MAGGPSEHCSRCRDTERVEEKEPSVLSQEVCSTSITGGQGSWMDERMDG